MINVNFCYDIRKDWPGILGNIGNFIEAAAFNF